MKLLDVELLKEQIDNKIKERNSFICKINSDIKKLRENIKEIENKAKALAKLKKEEDDAIFAKTLDISKYSNYDIDFLVRRVIGVGKDDNYEKSRELMIEIIKKATIGNRENLYSFHRKIEILLMHRTHKQIEIARHLNISASRVRKLERESTWSLQRFRYCN